MRAVLFLLALSLGPCLALGDVSESDTSDAAQERLIALYSTFSRTRVSTTTTMVTFSCHVTPAAATPCRRRRRKRSARAKRDSVLASPEMEAPELASSKEISADSLTKKEGKLFFTIWTTSFTTVTLTSFSTNFSTTASIELSCTVAGMSLLPNCK